MLSIVVVSSLFPSSVQPSAGIFIRERMFRVAKQSNLIVVSPQPWFPGQRLIRLIKPHYRLAGEKYEVVDGIEIHRPRFFALPAIGRRFDAMMMALRIFFLLRRLKISSRCDLLDAHFGFPDGAAAGLVGKLINVPVTVTLRGTEPGHLKRGGIRKRLLSGLRRASKIICVSQSLKDLMISNGVKKDKLVVVGNGVDNQKFSAMDKLAARRELNLPIDAKILITVGGLVERKGYHRVMQIMPSLLKENPKLIYLIVGGPSAEGDWSDRLRELAKKLKIAERIHFLGQISSENLRVPLSAADLFVLSSRNEGWANVILESMACGTPVIASDVGGNAEVVKSEGLGTIVAFDDPPALESAIRDGLGRNWESRQLIEYARNNDWSNRIDQLHELYSRLCNTSESYVTRTT